MNRVIKIFRKGHSEPIVTETCNLKKSGCVTRAKNLKEHWETIEQQKLSYKIVKRSSKIPFMTIGSRRVPKNYRRPRHL